MEQISQLKSKIKKHPVKLKTNGSSMLPTIYSGQIVKARSVKRNSLRVGNIILFHIDNQLYIHRIIYQEYVKDEFMYLTKGDSCDSLDDWVITNNNIVGIIEL